jgi:hypothetical protein
VCPNPTFLGAVSDDTVIRSSTRLKILLNRARLGDNVDVDPRKKG